MEILGGEAWLRAFIDIAMFIKGLTSSGKFWFIFLVSEHQAWLVFPSPACALLFLSPSFSPIVSLAVPQKHWGRLETHLLHCEYPSPFWPSPVSPYPHIHLSTPFCLLCPVCAMAFLSYLQSPLPSLTPNRSWCEHFFLLLLSCFPVCPHSYHI